MILARLNLCQNRRRRRFGCMVPVVCAYGGRTESATLVDLSEGGARLIMRGRLPAGSIVRLFYKPDTRSPSQPPVTAQVVWSGRNWDYCEAGLSWNSVLGWVPQVLETLATGDRADGRRTRRFNVEFSAAMVLPSIEVKGEVTDISYGGAAVVSTAQLALGSQVCLQVEGLSLPGTVVRSQAAEARTVHGVAFSDLPDDVSTGLSHLLRDLRSPGRTAPLVDKRLLR